MKCAECNGRMEKKVLKEKFDSQEVWVEEWICSNCGDKELDINEAIRIQKLISPPLSKRVKLLLSYPVEVLRKIVW